jgi:3-hydroxybutyryl-CoA dehydratase
LHQDCGSKLIVRGLGRPIELQISRLSAGSGLESLGEGPDTSVTQDCSQPGIQTLGLGFTWEQLSPGQRFRTINRTITETDLVLFTGVTGMLETIFIDRTFGEKGAIEGRFVPAALTYSLVEGLLCQSMIQGTGLAMLELKQQVLAPARIGDTVHGEIEVLSVRPTSKGNRGIVVSRIDVKNQHGETVMTYEATRMLAGRSPPR